MKCDHGKLPSYMGQLCSPRCKQPLIHPCDKHSRHNNPKIACVSYVFYFKFINYAFRERDLIMVFGMSQKTGLYLKEIQYGSLK